MNKDKSIKKIFEEELGVIEENDGITLEDCETLGEKVELEEFFKQRRGGVAWGQLDKQLRMKGKN